MTKVQAKRQPRRGGDEVRRLVLESAHRLFTEQGYHGTKTREIAEAAKVGESVVFRNFGSKAELFEATILESFNAFVLDWVESFGGSTPDATSSEEITRAFVVGFLDLATQHREPLLILMAARSNGGDPQLAQVADNVRRSFTRHLSEFRAVLLGQGEQRHFVGLDHSITLASAVGAVLSLALFDDWLFPSGERRPSRERRIDELTAMLLHGVMHR